MKTQKFRTSIALGIPLTILAALAAVNQYEPKPREVPTQQVAITQPTQDLTLEEKAVAVSDANPAETHSLSQEGIDFIKAFEDYKPDVYLDQAGRPTICYGHLLTEGESHETRTQEECNVFFEQDSTEHQKHVRELVTADLTQNQFDALVSLTYNIGPDALRTSTLLEKLNEGDYQGAAEQFSRWNKIKKKGVKKDSDGLGTRRAREEQIFVQGIYDSNH